MACLRCPCANCAAERTAERYTLPRPASGVGAQGPQGETGPQGPAGPQGGIGPTGPQGPQGNTGPQGATGNIGPQGPQGVAGATGATGPQGPAGTPGTVVAVCKNSGTQTNTSSSALVDITGMAVTLVANRRYIFRALVPFQSAATTTGIGFGWAGPAMTVFIAQAHIQTAAAGTDHIHEVTSTALATNLVSPAVVAAATTYLAVVEAVVQASAGGTLQLRFLSEVNASQVSVLNGAAGYLMDCG